MTCARHRLYCKRRRAQRGFTLIEIMVVAIVIVLLASVVNLALPDNSPEDQTRQAAEVFDRELRYIAEQAVLRGETYGLFVDLETTTDKNADKPVRWCLHWERVRGNQWEPLPEIGRAKCLPESVSVGVNINDKPWKYDTDVDFQEPVLGFFPSGDATGDVLIVFFAQSELSTGAARTNQLTREEDGKETFWISFMGDTHWISEERRQGIETRIDHNRRWFQ